MYETVKTEKKGNLVIQTEIQDEGKLHSWKCFFKGGWHLTSWGADGSYEKYECRGCWALKRYTFSRIKPQ